MRAVLIALALFSAAAWADEWVARHGADEVRLQETACANAGILAMLPPDERDTFRAASATVLGQHFDACWQPEDDGKVWLVYADGDQGILSMQRFKRVPSI